MGIARRKAGKISKAVTKSISKGGKYHVRKFDISSGMMHGVDKKRQNTKKTVRCVEKYFSADAARADACRAERRRCV